MMTYMNTAYTFGPLMRRTCGRSDLRFPMAIRCSVQPHIHRISSARMEAVVGWLKG